MDEATQIIAVVDPSSPVFVDSSGRRRKRIRIVFGLLGSATLVYGALVATSLAGGPLQPQQLLPFPELVNNLPVRGEPQPATGAQPGTKNTPAPHQSAVASAKKITATRPTQSGAAPAPTTGAPAAPGPGTTTTTAPPVESTSTPPTPEPSADPTHTPGPSADPTPTPSATPRPGQTEGTAGTALPGGVGTETAQPSRSADTVPVGETATATPGGTQSASPSVSGTGGTKAESDASAGLLGMIARLSPA